MHARHKRHLMHGSHHKDGGHTPPHIGHHKHRAKGGRTNHEPVNEGGGQHYPEGEHEPSLVAGNKNVVSAAKEKKSIGEVNEIYMHEGTQSKKRLDRRSRG